LLCNTEAGVAPNGLPYYFTVDAHTGTSPGGTGSPSVTATARSAGGQGTWSLGTPVGVSLNGVGYAALTTCLPTGLPTGIYAAVGPGGAIYSSGNGKVWTFRSPPNYTTNLNAVAAISGNVNVAPTVLMVAVGANGAAIRSFDGVTWSPSLAGSPAVPTLRSIAAAGSSFVAVGDNGFIETTSDGLTWVARQSNTAANLHAVQCFNSTCVAVGDAGVVDISVDSGATWFSRAVGNGTVTLRGVTYGNFDNNLTGSNTIGEGGNVSINTWVVVGDNGAAFQSTNLSADIASITWNAAPIASAANLVAVSYTTQFVAIDSSGNAFTSRTAVAGTWSAPVATGISDPVSLATNAHGYVVVGTSGNNASSF